jgi:hypothetical protein
MYLYQTVCEKGYSAMPSRSCEGIAFDMVLDLDKFKPINDDRFPDFCGPFLGILRNQPLVAYCVTCAPAFFAERADGEFPRLFEVAWSAT